MDDARIAVETGKNITDNDREKMMADFFSRC
jgi:hypothetical protein